MPIESIFFHLFPKVSSPPSCSFPGQPKALRKAKLIFLFLGLSNLLINPFTILAQNKIEKGQIVQIHNDDQGVWQGRPALRLELVRKIGDIEAVDERTAFYLPSDLAVDKEGNLYILDTGNHRIQKFSPEGKYLATLGRKGQGPGEFYFPSSLALDDQGHLYVADPNNQRIMVIDQSGQELKTIRLQEIKVNKIRCFSSEELIFTSEMRFSIQEEKPKLPPLLTIINHQGELIKNVGQPFDFKDLLLNRAANQVDFALGPDNSIYLTFLYQNRIEKYSPEGQLLWQADRKLNYRPGPQGKGSIERKGGSISVMMPRMNRCSAGIAVDAEGRVWVVTLQRQLRREERVGLMVGMTMADGQRSMSMKVRGNTELRQTDAFILQVFSSEGRLLGSIPLDIFVDSLFIAGHRLFLVDKLRGCSIYEYKIIEN